MTSFTAKFWLTGGLAMIVSSMSHTGLAADPILGFAAVLTTDTIKIGNQTIYLNHVKGSDSLRLSAEMQVFLSGKSLSCTLMDGKHHYRCVLPNGNDLSETVLENGGGRCDGKCPAAYRRAEQQARKQHLGVWRE
jgi:hypothetical protein